MPEADSDEATLHLSRTVAESLGIEALHQDITPILEAAGCYRLRDEAVEGVDSGAHRGLEVEDRAADRGRERLLPPLSFWSPKPPMEERSRSGFRRRTT